MIKLLSQFEQVERATPFARREEGKISTLIVSSGVCDVEMYGDLPDGIAHGTGPHDAPKLSM